MLLLVFADPLVWMISHLAYFYVYDLVSDPWRAMGTYTTCAMKMFARMTSQHRTLTKKQHPHRALLEWRTLARRHAGTSNITAYPSTISCSYTNTELFAEVKQPYDTDSVPIGIDNHASYCLTTNKDDFIDEPSTVNLRVSGISGNLSSSLKGTVAWTIEDDDGMAHTLTIPNVYLVEDLPIRLLSPQHLAQVYKSQETIADGTFCTTLSDRIVLYWDNRRGKRTVKLNQQNVAVIHTAPGYKLYQRFDDHYKSRQYEPKAFPAHLIPPDDEDMPSPHVRETPNDMREETMTHTSPGPMPTPDVTTPNQITFKETPVVEDDQEQELPRASDELLLWHYRLGHKPFSRLQAMAKDGHLPSRLATCRVPECAACRFGRATKVPWRTKGVSNKTSLHTATSPGQCVSIDQVESTTPGLIAQLKGKPTRQRYRYATIFVDHYSRFTFVYLQKTITSVETVDAKKAFEAYARSLGVYPVSHYHADNGRFADNLFVSDCAAKGQGISYCGVNAHWQNGIAEKRIRDLQESARTQLIHAKNRWNRIIEVHLWPYAMRYTASVDNSTPHSTTGISPIERFAQVDVRPKLRHFHPFGCPTYILRNELQSNKSLPKWSSRSRVGVYLGPSPRHSRSVALVLNPATGLASPQYHVRYDNLFETVEDANRRVECNWQHLCHFRDTPQPSKPKDKKVGTPTRPTTLMPSSQVDEGASTSPDSLLPNESPPLAEPLEDTGDLSNTTPAVVPETGTQEQGQDQQDATSPAPPVRPRRTPKPTTRMLEAITQEADGLVSFEALAQGMYNEEDHISFLDDPITAMKSSSDPDTLYYHEAMAAPDAKQFREAMIKEVNDHTERKHWRPILKSEVPHGTTILPAVWSMKRKRKIDTQQIYKWKSRLTLGGHKQDLDVPTYAPALSWATIRLFLIISIMFGWHTRQVDFVLAYPQAKAPRPTFMSLPKGIKFDGLNHKEHCLKIEQNLYGGVDAGRTWFLHLTAGLTKLGFVQSRIDDCVFYRGSTIFIVYTDDGLIFSPKEEDVAQTIADLKRHFTLEDQGNLQDYLGVHVSKEHDSSWWLTQPHLITSILIDLELLNPDGTERPNVKGRDLPALTTRIIGPDLTGKPFSYEWDYRSVIGKLNYLEKSSRPDIAFPVHQCARFMSNPKHSHGTAVKHIGRYLLATRDKGYRIAPSQNHSFDCYVDASFLGDWDKRIAGNDPNTAKSRTGFVLKYANAPIFWQSKLQTQFALSSAEAEYIALSAATRYVKSLMYLLDEMREKGIQVATTPTIHCTVFEDNSAALEIANVPKMRPRTRHINVVYHHFRNEVANGRIQVLPIGTKEQQGDLLTKQCDLTSFLRHRQSIMGW